ncbi:MAG: DUF6640 family protein [Pseudomonadota bacterium]
MKLILKNAVTSLTVLYGLVPAIADLNETRLFNLLWSEHARFHGAWFLTFETDIASIALFLIWVRDDVFRPITFSLISMASFGVATGFGPAYGGDLVVANGYVQAVFDIGYNIFLFSVVGALLSLLLVVAKRKFRTDK